MVSPSMTFLTLLSSIVSGVLAWEIGPTVADLNIVNAQIAPDGYSRPAVLVEGQFPGPLIVGKKGDRFTINVTDKLTDPLMNKATSVHWHGLYQKTTNWADGPSFVNQCPISPGHSFLYDFQVPDQAGTFWYHSHLSTQYCDGLRGAFVVYDSNDPHAHLYDVDDESTIITLADWYHYLAPQQARGPSSPASTLINGLGRYQGGPASPLAVINVEQGKRYRFRLVAMSCAQAYVFSIDGHNMTIIEADGVNTQPLTVDSLQIFAGQRYSVVVHADQPVNNYWVRANPNLGPDGFDGNINQAILRYVGALEQDPKTVGGTNFSTPLNETNLHAFEPGVPGAPNVDGADVNLHLQLGFNTTTRLFTVNGDTFIPPNVPVLLQILSGSAAPSDLLPAGSVYPLPLNKVIQITFSPGTASSIGGPHPFHLHGHSFDVVRSAGSSAYNWVNPVRRDTVNTGKDDDLVTIRFKTDNSGPWFLHCHIDWHLDAGFAIVLAEDVPGTKAANPVPESWKELCPIYNSLSDYEKGGLNPSTISSALSTTTGSTLKPSSTESISRGY